MAAAGIGLLCAISVFAAPTEDPANGTKSTAPVQRQREGAPLVDVLGHFKMTGDRATFYPLESQIGFGGLENLNLERVTLMIADNTGDLLWQVSGTITEFRGANYLLISKAVLKSQADPAEIASPRPGSPRPLQKQTGALSPRKK